MQISINLQQSYGEFLSQFPWDWYCILTFRNNISSRLAFKTFNRWKVRLKKAANRRIDYALFIEPTSLRDDIPHLHSLIHGVGEENSYVWEQHWFALAGQARIKPYNPELGAVFYLGQKMLSDEVSVVFSKNLRNITTERTLLIPKKTR
ncbi:hypothetical protein ACFLTJ_00240 [Chloroflexota bacterium]